MSDSSVIHNTFVIRRSYATNVERVFAAFADPAKKRRWFAEGDTHDVEAFEMDFQVGGLTNSRLRFKAGPIKGVTLTKHGRYLDIVPNGRIVVASNMSIGDRRISATMATAELVQTASGTDLIFTHQAAFFEGADGPQMREQGWHKLLDKLAAELAC